MADSIRMLRDMGFGSHGNNFLQKALDAHEGDLEQTVEALLNGWTGKPESDSRKSKSAKKKGSSNSKNNKAQTRSKLDTQPAVQVNSESVGLLIHFISMLILIDIPI